MIDFLIEPEASVWRFSPLTQAAKEWLAKIVADDPDAFVDGWLTTDVRGGKYLANEIEVAGFATTVS